MSNSCRGEKNQLCHTCRGTSSSHACPYMVISPNACGVQVELQKMILRVIHLLSENHKSIFAPAMVDYEFVICLSHLLRSCSGMGEWGKVIEEGKLPISLHIPDLNWYFRFTFGKIVNHANYTTRLYVIWLLKRRHYSLTAAETLLECMRDIRPDLVIYIEPGSKIPLDTVTKTSKSIISSLWAGSEESSVVLQHEIGRCC